MKIFTTMVMVIAGAVILGVCPTAGAMDFEHVMNIGSEGTGGGQFKYVEDFAFDSKGYLVATDAAHAYVQVFDKDGRHITMWGTKGSGNGEFGNLHGIIVDKGTGWVYVADTANNRIQVFKPKS